MENSSNKLKANKIELNLLQLEGLSIAPEKWSGGEDTCDIFYVFSKGRDNLLLHCARTSWQHLYPKEALPPIQEIVVPEEKLEAVVDFLISESWVLKGIVKWEFTGLEGKMELRGATVAEKMNVLIGKKDKDTFKLARPVLLPCQLEFNPSWEAPTNILGNYLADLTRIYTGSDIVLLLNGMIITTLSANEQGEPVDRGLLTVQDIYRALAGIPCCGFYCKFFNVLQLKEILEGALECLFTASKEEELTGERTKNIWAMQVSGLKVEFSPQKEAGNRIENIYFYPKEAEDYIQILKGGEPFGDSELEVYELAYPDFLGRGIWVDLEVKDDKGKVIYSGKREWVNSCYEHLLVYLEEEEVRKVKIENSFLREQQIKQTLIINKIIEKMKEVGETMVFNEVYSHLNSEALQFIAGEGLWKYPLITPAGEIRQELKVPRILPI